jgi:hypothetical protein
MASDLVVRAEHLAVWAHRYAEHGWSVFPLSPGTKIPALSRKQGGKGCLDAVTDPATVTRMWQRFPLANIGIATGPASNLSVLDVDPRHGGTETLSDLIARETCDLADGPTARTPSGGLHYYMEHRDDLRTCANQIGPGLDVRSGGGYVAAYPSAIPGVGAYSWLRSPDIDPPPWPDWLMPPPTEPTVVRNPVALERVSGDKVLDGLVNTVLAAPEGARNDKLFWASCRLGEHAAAGRIPLDVGAAALLDAAERIGLPTDEANKTLDSALRRYGARPGVM